MFFLLFLLTPLFSVASPCAEYVKARIHLVEQEAFEVRNMHGRDAPLYWYLCGRLDSYYDLLYHEWHPLEVYAPDKVEHCREPDH